MTSERVAERYIKALHETAVGEEAKQAVGAALARLQAIYAQNPQFRAALANPRIPDERKTDLLMSLAEVPQVEVLRAFFQLVTRKRRTDVFSCAGRLYQKIDDETAGVRRVFLQSANALSPAQLTAVKESLTRFFNGRVVIETEVNPELIGGIRLQSGDLLLDGSIRARLELLREQLSGTVQREHTL